MMRKSTLSILLGLLIIALGVVYAGNVIGFWDLDISFAGWWTLFIIVPCAVSTIFSKPNFVNSTGLVAGVLMLLSEQNILKNGLGYKLVLPLIIIAIGLGILLHKRGRRGESTNGIFAGSRGENHFAVVGKNVPKFDGEVFRGAKAFAIFGGVDLYLRDAVIKRDCAINVYSIFGGANIVLPDNVRCTMSSIPVFGSINNRFTSSVGETAPTVYIRVITVFGATDIK